MKKILERDIQNEIKDWCKKRNIYHRKISQRFASGFPDTITVHNGKVFFLELKRPGKNPTKLQSIELEEIRKSGGISGVARSLNDFIGILVAETDAGML